MRQEIAAALSKFSSVWNESLGDHHRQSSYRSKIKLQPSFPKSISGPVVDKRAQGQKTDQRLEKDVVEPAVSEWTSLVVSDLKKER